MRLLRCRFSFTNISILNSIPSYFYFLPFRFPEASFNCIGTIALKLKLKVREAVDNMIKRNLIVERITKGVYSIPPMHTSLLTLIQNQRYG